MSRWHKDSCTTPDVSITSVSGSVRCRCGGCNSSPEPFVLPPSVTDFTSIQAATNDGPLKDLSLHWPSCVPYFPPKPLRQVHSSKAAAPIEDESATAHRLPSSIYDILHPDEFRLLRLNPLGNKEGIVHLTLHTYRHSNCPEYETVSYTWGGEDNDSTLCQPIYVGEYWDVLFQTTNCWEMLKHLSPRDGTRLLWVDALCINQMDQSERQDQVAKMGRIYEDATRVVVFLGRDIVSPLPPGQHPSRHRLHELERVGKVSLNEILNRRYFSRVWVIQELILSRQAIIPIGNTEFWVDQVALTKLQRGQPRLSWSATSAPWFQHVGTNGSNWIDDIDGNGFYDMLRLSWASQATDLRDKVFGILGLAENSRYQLRPDYSIDVRHVFIGTFAHCLLNLGDTRILAHAAGIDACGASPSWLPNWTSEQLCPEFQTAFNVKLRPFHDAPDDWTRSWMRRVELKLQGEPGQMVFTSLFLTDPARIQTWDYQNGSGRLYTNLSLWNSPYEWYEGASVVSSKGALSLNLVHLFPLHQRPALVGKSGSCQVFEFKYGSNSDVYIEVRNTDLATNIYPGQDHLFLLDAGTYRDRRRTEDKSFGNSTSIYLILRHLGVPNTYRLVCCCQQLYFRHRFHSSPRNNSSRVHEDNLELWRFRKITGYQRFSHDFEWWFWGGVDVHLCEAAFIESGNFEAKFTVLQGVFNEEKNRRPNFLDSYMSYAARFGAKRTRDNKDSHEDRAWIQLQLQPHQWKELRWKAARIVWEQWSSTGVVWNDSLSWFDRPPVDDGVVHIRSRIGDLRKHVSKHYLLTKIRDFDVSDKLLWKAKEEFAMWGRNKTFREFSLVRAAPAYPAGLEDFESTYHLDGSTVRVTIV